MSIIQEALKKAQKTNGGNYDKGDYAITMGDLMADSKGKRPVKKYSKPVIYMVTVLTLLSLAVSGFVIKHYLPALIKIYAKAAPPVIIKAPVAVVEPEKPAPAAPVAPPQPVAEPAPVLLKPPVDLDAEFILSGIIHTNKGLRAIINNSRVAEGDKLSGATIVAITEDTVTLKKDDAEATLRLN